VGGGGVGVWGGAPHPQPPTPQSPIPNPQIYHKEIIKNKNNIILT